MSDYPYQESEKDYKQRAQRVVSYEDFKSHMPVITIEEETVKDLFEYLQAQDLKVETTSEGMSIFSFELATEPELPLPYQGYGYMGGAAREWLRKELGITSISPRDLDVTVIDSFNGDMAKETMDEISKRYMPHDFKHGHGVKATDLDTYFETKDLTINEVLVVYLDGRYRMYASGQALLDTFTNTVRLTAYEVNKYSGNIGSYHALKALRLYCELKISHGEQTANIAQEKDVNINFNHSNLDAFNVALNLQKSAERGQSLLIEFYSELLTRDGIDPDFLDQIWRKPNAKVTVAEIAKFAIFVNRVLLSNPFNYIPEIDQDFFDLVEGQWWLEQIPDEDEDKYEKMAHDYYAKHLKKAKVELAA